MCSWAQSGCACRSRLGGVCASGRARLWACHVGVNKASLGQIAFCAKSWSDHLELWPRGDLRASKQVTSFALPQLAAISSGMGLGGCILITLLKIKAKVVQLHWLWGESHCVIDLPMEKLLMTTWCKILQTLASSTPPCYCFITSSITVHEH